MRAAGRRCTLRRRRAPAVASRRCCVTTPIPTAPTPPATQRCCFSAAALSSRCGLHLPKKTPMIAVPTITNHETAPLGSERVVGFGLPDQCPVAAGRRRPRPRARRRHQRDAAASGSDAVPRRRRPPAAQSRRPRRRPGPRRRHAAPHLGPQRTRHRRQVRSTSSLPPCTRNSAPTFHLKLTWIGGAIFQKSTQSITASFLSNPARLYRPTFR